MGPRQQGLLEAEGRRAPGPPSALVSPPETGLLATNHLNLHFMLAAGMLMPPAGFQGKYFEDSLGACPGWIPLFVGKAPPPSAVEQATAEAAHLKPVLIEVDLTALEGPVRALGGAGLGERSFRLGLASDETAILVPAPLPANAVRRVVFRTAADKRACEESAGELGNVPLTDVKRATNKRLFAGSPDVGWPPAGWPDAREVASLEVAQAAGGVMAALFHLANRGPLAVAVCRAAFGGDEPEAAPVDDPLLGALPEWIRAGAVVDLDEPRASSRGLFWGAVERLVRHRRSTGGGSAEDLLIQYLEEAAALLGGAPASRARELARTLDALGGVGGGAVSELFERHETTFSRAIILFSLRRKTIDLLEPNFDDSLLTERDLVAAGILFGVRDGWLGLPMELRQPKELGAAVSHRMAEMAHRLDRTGIDLGRALPRPVPLRELLGDRQTWRRREQAAAAHLARRLKWDCIRTRVSLPRGRYELAVEGGSAHIDFRGEPRVDSQVDRRELLRHLARARIDPKLEGEVRRKLGV